MLAKVYTLIEKRLECIFFQVRGAPAIGIAALLSLAVELTGKNVANWSLEEVQQWSKQKLDHLVTSRPTGVNLKIECTSVKGIMLQGKYYKRNQFFAINRPLFQILSMNPSNTLMIRTS